MGVILGEVKGAGGWGVGGDVLGRLKGEKESQCEVCSQGRALQRVRRVSGKAQGGNELGVMEEARGLSVGREEEVGDGAREGAGGRSGMSQGPGHAGPSRAT